MECCASKSVQVRRDAKAHELMEEGQAGGKMVVVV